MNAARLLLCTDLDRTLLPNGLAAESPGARELFARLVTDPALTLAYVSGRHLQLVDEAIARYALPVPHYAITDVGTTIYAHSTKGWQQWQGWDEEIARDWNGANAAALAPLFDDVALLRLQRADRQGRHKLSFYLDADALPESLAGEMRRRLHARAMPSNLVFSIDDEIGVGLLDVVPARASKLHAIGFLCARGDYSRDEVLFAGDSGNDLAVMQSDLASVLVANASAAVRAEALALARAAGHADRLYLARGGYLGMNGNYAAGIVEGVQHFFPQFTRILQ